MCEVAGRVVYPTHQALFVGLGRRRTAERNLFLTPDADGAAKALQAGIGTVQRHSA